MIWLELHFTTLFVCVLSIRAQLSPNELMRNVTHCDLNVDINLNCGTDAVIAVHTLQYAYNVTCETTCCQYSSYHCFVDAEINDIKDVRRICSGKNSCAMSINTVTTDFTTCSLGVKPVSYVFLQYYCITETRIRSICSNGQPLSSTSPTNQPLYITNEGYPAVTTGAMVCSCSLEIFSCSSKINLYIIDADLYLDTTNCEQRITFNDQVNQTLKTVACEDYYGNQIAKTLLDSHYAKIEFNSSSTQNLEGYFFLGFDSSEQDVSFQLTCSSQPNTWCTGCGGVPTINNGNITLSKEGDDSFGATAIVSCDTGYKTDTPTISCRGNGTWSTAECTEKPACATGQWRCDNGDCISEVFKCDTAPQCPDESDEQNCTIKTETGSPAKDDTEDDTIIIVVVVLVFVFLVQLLCICYLQCKALKLKRIAADGDTEIPKRILMTIWACIPAVGLIAICMTWKQLPKSSVNGLHA